MTPAAIEATRQANAMQEAFRNAKVLAPKKPARAPAPTKPSRSPRAPVRLAGDPVGELVARIKLRASKGLVDLTLPASDLVHVLGATDVRQLTLAMTQLGFVRVHRGVTGQVFYRKKA
jgi:hypothetical protein